MVLLARLLPRNSVCIPSTDRTYTNNTNVLLFILSSSIVVAGYVVKIGTITTNLSYNRNCSNTYVHFPMSNWYIWSVYYSNEDFVYTIPHGCKAAENNIADRPSVYTITDSFRADVKTIADRPSVYTLPDSFRAAVKTIGDRPSVYTIPDSFHTPVKTIADRPSVYTIPDSFRSAVKAIVGRPLFTLYRMAFAPL